MKSKFKKSIPIIIIALFTFILIFLSPKILNWNIQQKQTLPETFQEFPVTVNPKNKTIIEDAKVNAFLADKHSLFGAAIIDTENFFWGIFENLAMIINNSSWYQSLANVNTHFITIPAGMRKEQVATIFGDALKWNNKQRKSFINLSIKIATSSISEGLYSPGIYSISSGNSPEEIQRMINERFANDVLSHYGTTTQDIVPLNQAITIASLIQRETITNDGMRLLSGIIWNRLFAGMNLQIDSTLQYAKANKASEKTWWPNVIPADKYITSPYNTYLHKGLPPTPIANPSVAAILAALNPINTSCLFYFNDKKGNFHCSNTYEEHVKLIKQYYKN